MCIPGLAEGMVVWAAVWYHMAKFITVAASSPAVVIHSNAAEGLGLEAAAWRKRDVKKRQIGLPWWLSGKESTCHCRRHKVDPWSGKIPRAVEQLSPCATTIESVLQSWGITTTEAHAP